MKNMTIEEYIENHRKDLSIDRDHPFAGTVVLVVEVPHQRKAQAFAYAGKEEYERHYLPCVEEQADRGDGIDHPEGGWSAEAVEEYAAHDLHCWRKLTGLDEILSFIPVPHQRLEVWRAVTGDLYRIGILADSERPEDVEEWTDGSGTVNLEIGLEDAKDCTHPGPCDADIRDLSEKPYIASQLEKIDPGALKNTLAEYGAWDDTEIEDHDENLQRILWIACGDIAEGNL